MHIFNAASLAATFLLGVSVQAGTGQVSSVPTAQRAVGSQKAAKTSKPVLIRKTETMDIYEARDRYIVKVLDPYADFNKLISDFNAEVYQVIDEPADFYRNSDVMLPLRWVLGAVSNILDNVTELTVGTTSNLLSGKFEDAGISTARALVNFSTSAGMYDVATVLSTETVTDPSAILAMNPLQQLENSMRSDVKSLRKPKITNLSDTFHEWGFGCGLYMVAPLMGPSTGRDMAGKLAQIPLDPETYVQPMIIVRAASGIHSGLMEAARAKNFLKEYNLSTAEGKAEYYRLLRTAILSSHQCLDDEVIKKDAAERGIEIVDEFEGIEDLK